ncbi:3-oxoacyl-[acyl-carrier protein] reductase [Variovorax beijingensis]|jgi:3-oxoacyl-[acyl-carrier protein] reductase|uniref:3-oxoacyl-[acyl-carrier protein] reductase n=2 Tax=Variovorax TaxID=34072 RepID=A0AAE3XWV6_VARPD|nr:MULTISPECIES: SDR family NAD(P)-dependent oxidoreductase [Variovorax]MBD9664511.1 SDR family oxidoreductase [Variovorax sp. VRV01]MDP9964096.1 3-oxoacyl-[acyl-carrier protein] reductase [Variovorax paradoxus]MDR6425166.1 3-oxoacyl-[acyl-carrier protein] reductase [Variovorax paradoxus]MDR6453621.1 3-oxoacyl-[acyl-carrier protein] reductase [Variovorax paradoxus]TWD87446.1 3-oxoacyl-[acyl-carrier protein] reductase [Variovorax beijingensis]
MNNSSEDKPLILVTGGASGMGRAIVERMARDGWRVVMADHNGELAERETQALRAAGLDVECRAIDLTDEPAVRAMVQALPPLTALVNNAGIFDERKFMDVSSADFRRMYEVNLLAVATLTQEAARKMADGARIVNIASRAYLGAKNHPHYVASKAALVGYTRASAMELAPRGIMVNAIAPGLIDTPLLRALTPERLAAQLALQPTGAAGRPEDIANAVAFFASPSTGFVTGQVLFVDGGKSLGGSGA